MYREPLLKVCKIDNGFLLEVYVPMEKEEYDGPSYANGEEKVFFVKDEAAMAEKIAKLLPILAKKSNADAAFKAAFTDMKE